MSALNPKADIRLNFPKRSANDPKRPRRKPRFGPCRKKIGFKTRVRCWAQMTLWTIDAVLSMIARRKALANCHDLGAEYLVAAAVVVRNN
jgi:hypothetical protein